MKPDEPLLDVRGLSIDYLGEDSRRLHAVEKVSFQLQTGETLGMVGESGCGKTTVMLALLRLLPAAGRIVGGEVLFEGRDLLSLSEAEMNRVRWKEISIVFQGAMNALNPVRPVGSQITEVIKRHEGEISSAECSRRAAELLDMVGISANRTGDYPFQFSGGMRQRAMIAMALACRPKILIADEPTTALDVMIQAQILELLQELRSRLGLAVILVTHDLGVVAELCDTVLVMYGGMTAEYAGVDAVYNRPRHPYTRDLLRAFPDISNPTGQLVSIPGYPPRLDELPPGCRFAPRCPLAFDRCRSEQPKAVRLSDTHLASCFLLEQSA